MSQSTDASTGRTAPKRHTLDQPNAVPLPDLLRTLGVEWTPTGSKRLRVRMGRS